MRLLRFRLRTLMILVAVIAVLFGRSINFWNLARHHEREMSRLIPDDLDFYLTMTAAGRGGTMHPDSGHPIAELVVPVRAFIAYHRELEEKYDKACHHPWLLVAPDPPAHPAPSKAHLKLYHTLLH